MYMSLHHEACERLPSFPPSSMSPFFGLADAVNPYIQGDGAHSAINRTLRRHHYNRWEVTVTYDPSLESTPSAATIARRTNALYTMNEATFPINVWTMSASAWQAKVAQRQEELKSALSQVHSKDRFLPKSRMPNSVWVELLGTAAMLLDAFGKTSPEISSAAKEYLLQIEHATAAEIALQELTCPAKADAMEAKRARLVKDWLATQMTRDRRSGELKPIKSRDELRADTESWNRANRFTRGKTGFLSKRGSPAQLIQRLAEAAVSKRLSAEDARAAEERMSSCPRLGANEVPPAGIPPSEWASTTARGRELLLAAVAMRCRHAADWFRDRAQLADEVPREERNVYDDERDDASETAGNDDDVYYEEMAMEHVVESTVCDEEGDFEDNGFGDDMAYYEDNGLF